MGALEIEERGDLAFMPEDVVAKEVAVDEAAREVAPALAVDEDDGVAKGLGLSARLGIGDLGNAVTTGDELVRAEAACTERGRGGLGGPGEVHAGERSADVVCGGGGDRPEAEHVAEDPREDRRRLPADDLHHASVTRLDGSRGGDAGGREVEEQARLRLGTGPRLLLVEAEEVAAARHLERVARVHGAGVDACRRALLAQVVRPKKGVEIEIGGHGQDRHRRADYTGT